MRLRVALKILKGPRAFWRRGRSYRKSTWQRAHERWWRWRVGRPAENG